VHGKQYRELAYPMRESARSWMPRPCTVAAPLYNHLLSLAQTNNIPKRG